ncbi:MAG: hypothetical protein ACREQR_00370 [Candidatus Binataceae bacterium]
MSAGVMVVFGREHLLRPGPAVSSAEVMMYAEPVFREVFGGEGEGGPSPAFLI